MEDFKNATLDNKRGYPRVFKAYFQIFFALRPSSAVLAGSGSSTPKTTDFPVHVFIVGLPIQNGDFQKLF